jgi:hypothetical protein
MEKEKKKEEEVKEKEELKEEEQEQEQEQGQILHTFVKPTDEQLRMYGSSDFYNLEMHDVNREKLRLKLKEMSTQREKKRNEK